MMQERTGGVMTIESVSYCRQHCCAWLRHIMRSLLFARTAP